jgi:two-component sensor histidine kinase/DNA-binding response OmpR family regulator
MAPKEKINILLVDDQPAKLLSYEAILGELGENLIKTTSARQALEQLLRTDVAIVLIDVCMPELDGFDLAAMIREHPRFQRTALIFVSAIHLAEVDHLRGYEMGAVDYVPVPVVPEVLRAKVRVFADLYRKTRELETLNRELEQRVAQRTAELEASSSRLRESEQRRSLALAAGQMGSWDWDLVRADCYWDEGQCRICGVEPGAFVPTIDNVRALVHPEDWCALQNVLAHASPTENSYQAELRVLRPDGEKRWCLIAASAGFTAEGKLSRVSGVTIDITERKQAEERQGLLAREVDHRARNTLAIVQAIIRLTQAKSTESFIAAIDGRIQALAQTQTLLSQSSWQGADIAQLVVRELSPYRSKDAKKVTIEGPPAFLRPDTAHAIAMALHELATNAAKYGALSSRAGEISVRWEIEAPNVVLRWAEAGGPSVKAPTSQGFGTKIINASIKGQIGGRVLFDWRPEGLHCTIAVPHGEAVGAAATAGDSINDGNLVALRSGASKRLLLVEDEAVVGMMMRDVLGDIGYFVTGPFCTLNEALAAAGADNFEGAILDVNLAGEMVYPVAEILSGRGVPFVFVTGYDDGGIDDRYRNVPMVQKPIAREDLEAALRAAFDRNAEGEMLLPAQAGEVYARGARTA